MTFLFFSCGKRNQIEHVDRAFYYWKGSYINHDLKKEVADMQVDKLYIKLFEVDYTIARGNFPYEKFRPSNHEFIEFDSIEIIPVVFIRNDIFKYNDNKSLDKLADNITFLIEKYSKAEYRYDEKDKVFDYQEIQIDCDWTKTTKEKYFYLLKKIKELSGKRISCTLRLYPYSYPETMGVPPVDKAMLMCYNLIKPLSEKEKNSILDIPELQKYLNMKKSYPLHLDIALPVFSWTQLYKNNRFSGLVHLSSTEVQRFTRQMKPMWYQVERDTTIDYSLYLKAGDQLKCEDISVEKIHDAIEIIRKNVELNDNTTISLFDLDLATFQKYSHEEISGFYDRFIP